MEATLTVHPRPTFSFHAFSQTVELLVTLCAHNSGLLPEFLPEVNAVCLPFWLEIRSQLGWSNPY